MNIQMYSVNMVPDNYGATSAMDRMVSQATATSGILNEYFYGHATGSQQMVMRPIPLYDLMNLDEYAPGVLFNAMA